MIKQAVILAGGQGIRLRPLTLTVPKPLIPINGKPFVQYLVENLKENGIKEIIFLTGYLSEQIEKHFKDGKRFGLQIKYSFSPIEYDTGARIREAKKLLDNKFLLLYSDNYWPLDIKQMSKFYIVARTQALVTVYKNTDSYTKNNIKVSEDGFVEIYDKSHLAEGLNGVDIGFFILKKSGLKNLPKENFSFEKQIIPKLIEQKQLVGYLTNHKYYGLSNHNRIPAIEEYFKNKKVIFLDRDGVINKKPPKADYVKKWDEFHLLPHSIEALKLLTQKGYEIYLVSNQAGIARGVMSEKNLKEIHKIFLQICKKNNIIIKDIYYCPHSWDEGCFCRKPQPGMFFKAAQEHFFDLTKALFIGDDIRDKEAGHAAGCKTILMKPDGNLIKVVNKLLKE